MRQFSLFLELLSQLLLLNKIEPIALSDFLLLLCLFLCILWSCWLWNRRIICWFRNLALSDIVRFPSFFALGGARHAVAVGLNAGVLSFSETKLELVLFSFFRGHLGHFFFLWGELFGTSVGCSILWSASLRGGSRGGGSGFGSSSSSSGA